MSYYDEIYLKRLNRYGDNYQSRIQGQREREFDDYLSKTIYRINFTYDGETYLGSLEPYKENKTEVQAYLLTKICLTITNGTILMLPDKDGVDKPWMVWWLETMKASGYNRYVLLRLSHEIEWIDDKGTEHIQWAYFYGPGTLKIKDMTRSKVANSLYSENNNLYMFITAVNPNISKDMYFEVAHDSIIQAYRVTNFDVTSTIGVEYISVDPVYIRDKTATPEPGPGDKDEDFYWLNNGGVGNGNT